jgi:hypothetical protein
MADIYPLYDIKYVEALGEKLSHSIFDRSRNTKSCSTSLVMESMVVSFLSLGFEVGVTYIHMHIKVGVTCIHMHIEERRRESRGGKSDVGNGSWEPPPLTPQVGSKSGEAQEWLRWWAVGGGVAPSKIGRKLVAIGEFDSSRKIRG